MSIFAFFCEAFLGVKPSVALFHHFCSLRVTAARKITGCVSFRLADRDADGLIPMAVTKKVEDFRKRWVYINTTSTEALLQLPLVTARRSASRWRSERLDAEQLGSLLGRILRLKERGLTGQMVARQFLTQHITPLQAHRREMWSLGDRAD